MDPHRRTNPSPWLLLLLVGTALVSTVYGVKPEKGAVHSVATENHALSVITAKPYPTESGKTFPTSSTKKVPSSKATNGTTTTTANTTVGSYNVTVLPANVTNATVHANATTLSPVNVSSANGSLHGGDKVHKISTGYHFLSSWFTWREDSYAISILIPIICGMSAAVLIICTLWCIACCKRRCRSRYRRKACRQLDPKTIRKMKASDRIKLLAASSDEEF